MTAVFLRFNTRKALLSLEIEEKAILILGTKSVVECLEEVLYDEPLATVRGSALKDAAPLLRSVNFQ